VWRADDGLTGACQGRLAFSCPSRRPPSCQAVMAQNFNPIDAAASIPTCPTCGVHAFLHASGPCLDRWVHEDFVNPCGRSTATTAAVLSESATTRPRPADRGAAVAA
jgi:hypothetical protein